MKLLAKICYFFLIFNVILGISALPTQTIRAKIISPQESNTAINTNKPNIKFISVKQTLLNIYLKIKKNLKIYLKKAKEALKSKKLFFKIEKFIKDTLTFFKQEIKSLF